MAGLARVPDAASIGIDTWGVDYGLLDAAGALLAEPIAYRDDRTTKVVDAVHALVPPDELYAVNGLQFLPFTTVYQLAAEQQGPRWDRAAHAVLLPDLFAHLLTGELRTEQTNASTTGLLDVRSHDWSGALLARLGIPRDLLPPVEAPGAVRGRTASGTPVTTVGSHDTASAVVAVPATTERFAYVVQRHLVPRRAGARRLRRQRGGPGRQLHQRARRRRPNPVPAQRRRPVAARRSASGPGRARTATHCWPRRPCCRPAARSSTPTTPPSSRPGGMPGRIAAAAGARRR